MADSVPWAVGLKATLKVLVSPSVRLTFVLPLRMAKSGLLDGSSEPEPWRLLTLPGSPERLPSPTLLTWTRARSDVPIRTRPRSALVVVTCCTGATAWPRRLSVTGGPLFGELIVAVAVSVAERTRRAVTIGAAAGPPRGDILPLGRAGPGEGRRGRGVAEIDVAGIGVGVLHRHLLVGGPADEDRAEVDRPAGRDGDQQVAPSPRRAGQDQA